MPLYEFVCTEDESHPSQEHWAPISGRDSVNAMCACGAAMTRLPGGTGLLYFEEGRGRVHEALGHAPITSHGQHERLMRQHGVTECGNTVPESVRRNPKSKGMKEFLSKDKGGKWI